MAEHQPGALPSLGASAALSRAAIAPLVVAQTGMAQGAMPRAATEEAVTVGAIVRELTALLGSAGVEEAASEARDIVAAVVDMPRFWPSMNATDSLASDAVCRARAAAARRASGAPFAYAVGRAAFRHLTLDVDERVLIPRQETETLVDAVLESGVRGKGGVAVDVGTGSGAIALALAMEGSFDLVIGTDVSSGALSVARANVQRLAPSMKAPLEFRAGSLLAPVRDVRARVVVSNPPYIAHDEAAALPRSVRDWEPPVALFSASGGMAATTQIIRDAPDILESGGVLAIEVDSRRAALAAEAALADGRYGDVSVRLDLTGRERILLARRV
jgi:release factor glutamine methyltransferase